jgi:hypothetical protein
MQWRYSDRSRRVARVGMHSRFGDNHPAITVADQHTRTSLVENATRCSAARVLERGFATGTRRREGHHRISAGVTSQKQPSPGVFAVAFFRTPWRLRIHPRDPALPDRYAKADVLAAAKFRAFVTKNSRNVSRSSGFWKILTSGKGAAAIVSAPYPVMNTNGTFRACRIRAIG